MALADSVQPVGEGARGGAQQYLELPADIPQAIRAAAQEVTQGSEDSLQAASALEAGSVPATSPTTNQHLTYREPTIRSQ